MGEVPKNKEVLPTLRSLSVDFAYAHKKKPTTQHDRSDGKSAANGDSRSVVLPPHLGLPYLHNPQLHPLRARATWTRRLQNCSIIFLSAVAPPSEQRTQTFCHSRSNRHPCAAHDDVPPLRQKRTRQEDRALRIQV